MPLLQLPNNLGEGGYKVIISGGYDTSLVGWIFIDRPYSSAKLQNRTCDYVALNGEAAVDTFYYRNPVNGVPVKLTEWDYFSMVVRSGIIHPQT